MSKTKSKKTNKTNALRSLDSAGIKYDMNYLEIEGEFTSGVDMAARRGQNPAQVFKTLVTEANNGERYVCVIPVDQELDLKKAAKHFGVKKIEMLRSKNLLGLTGYIHGGCSPIGMKKQFPTAIHESANDFDTIFVSGGKIGLQIEIAVPDLVEHINATVTDLT